MNKTAKYRSCYFSRRGESCSSSAADVQHEPAKQSVDYDDSQQDTNVLASSAGLVAIGVEESSARNQALRAQGSVVGTIIPTMTIGGASVVSAGKLVDHHALKNVALVVDVMEHVAPEGIEVGGTDHEAHSTHPKTVGESSGGESNNEDGNKAGDEDNKRLGSDQVKEEPHNPSPEAASGVAEVAEPVDDNAEEERDDEQIRQTSHEVTNKERRGSVEAVGTFLHEDGAVLEVGRDVCDGHEGHEGTSEENSVSKSLEIALRRVQTQPDSTHHDSQTHIHGNANAVSDDITIRLDEVAMNECDEDIEPVSTDLIVVVGILRRRVAMGNLAGDSAQLLGVKTRALPGSGDHLKLGADLSPVMSKVGVHEVDDELSRVHVERNGEAACIKERLNVLNWSTVCCVAMREEKKLVEHCKCRG